MPLSSVCFIDTAERQSFNQNPEDKSVNPQNTKNIFSQKQRLAHFFRPHIDQPFLKL